MDKLRKHIDATSTGIRLRNMKKCCLAGLLLLVNLFSHQAYAVLITIDPSDAVTLTAPSNDITAPSEIEFSNPLDDFTNAPGFQLVERAFVEFDISAFTSPIQGANLNFVLDNAYRPGQGGPDSLEIYLDGFAGNGLVEASDWFASATRAATVLFLPRADGSDSIYSVNITDLVNASIGVTSHVGISFSLEENNFTSMFFNRPHPSLAISVSEPDFLATMVLGALILVWIRKKKSRVKWL